MFPDKGQSKSKQLTESQGVFAKNFVAQVDVAFLHLVDIFLPQNDLECGHNRQFLWVYHRVGDRR